MIGSILSRFTDPNALIELLLTIPVVLISLTIHEVSHGFLAYKLGDPTAKYTGRLSLNPVKHLDPIGALCMLFFGFGWAKPVPVNTRYFKKPKRDMALTALAGPVSNIILSFVSLIILKLFTLLFLTFPAAYMSFGLRVQIMTLTFFSLMHYLNLYLALFNLIPIPPLDGSRVLLTFLPAKYYFGVMKYERYIMLAFMLILLLPMTNGIITGPLTTLAGWISGGMGSLIGLIPGL